MTAAARFTPLTACLCCGSDDLTGCLDLGDQPLPHAYQHDVQQLRFPLELNVCGRCFHHQLSIAVDPALRARDDLFASYTTRALRDHLGALAKDALAFAATDAAGRVRGGERAPRVLDVGCSDGALLEELNLLGCDVVGADRSASLRELVRRKGLRVLDAPWGQAAVDELRAAGDEPFELIVAADVLTQVSDPLGFLRACADALAPGGTIVLEVPYRSGSGRGPRAGLDLPHHDRVSYFLVRSLAVLAKRAALEIQHVERSARPGGGLRLYLRAPERVPAHCTLAHAFMDGERQDGRHDLRTYAPTRPSAGDSLQDRVRRRGGALRCLLDAARRAGRRPVGYGATATGTVVQNVFDLQLDHVVDDDPLKLSCRVPGRDTPIRSSRTLIYERGPLAIVVFTPDSLDEVRRKVLAFRGTHRDDQILFCTPVLAQVSTWVPPHYADLGEPHMAGGFAS